MPTTNRKMQRTEGALPIVHRDAAGSDIGATIDVVAVTPDLDDKPVRKSQSFTRDLLRLAEPLNHVGIA